MSRPGTILDLRTPASSAATGCRSHGPSTSAWGDFGAVGSVVVPAGVVSVDGEALDLFGLVVFRTQHPSVRQGRSAAVGPGVEVIDLEVPDPQLTPGMGAPVPGQQDRLTEFAGEQPPLVAEVHGVAGVVDDEPLDLAQQRRGEQIRRVDG